MRASEPESEAPEAEVGLLLVDTRTDRVGVVMGNVGSYVQLRPPGGGTEWDVPPSALRPAEVLDELRAKVTVVNAQGRRPR
ncbi:hypothetical protein GCM10010347_33350 [Streptomyces cirratus]|uniref:Secreted protein n=1 Tax=Streptomyces cirratus TaxID=68187 RepID=A0ABQ3EU30_9ACTN|nr:hypothetical protein GCM10010347_33350 [Streptomyces cirratus]